jgi:hypothetical protein
LILPINRVSGLPWRRLISARAGTGVY